MRGLRAGLFQRVEAIEREFVEKTETGINGGTAPSLECAEAPIVECFTSREHLLGAHAGGGEALMAIAEDIIVKLN